MADPVLKAIQGAIVSISVSDPKTGAMLGRLKLQPNMDVRTALKLDRDVLLYNKKTLTQRFLFSIRSNHEKRTSAHHTNIPLIRCLVRGFD